MQLYFAKEKDNSKLMKKFVNYRQSETHNNMHVIA